MHAKMVNVTKESFRKTCYFTLIWVSGFDIGKQVVGKSPFKYLIKVRHLFKNPMQNKGKFSKASLLIVPFLSFYFVRRYKTDVISIETLAVPVLNNHN